MSTYTHNTSAYHSTLNTLRLAMPEHEAQFRAISEGLTSSALTDISADLSMGCRMETPEDVRVVLDQLPSWESMFSETTYGEFSAIEAQIEKLDQLSADEVGAGIAAIHGDLVKAMGSAIKEVATFEQHASVEAVRLALSDLGYTVAFEQQPGVVAGFEASRGDSKFLVQVADGQIATDHIGVSDGETCDVAQETFAARVRYYGVGLTEAQRRDHRDPRGGSLAQVASRSAGRTLAERIVNAYRTTPRRTDKSVRATLREIS